MKKKLNVLFLVYFALAFQPHRAEALGGAQGANMAMLQSIIGGGASIAYAIDKAGQCGRFNKMACVQAVLGALQAIQMFKGAGNSYERMDMLTNDLAGIGGTFNPGENGFCFNGQGCSPDGIDSALSPFQGAFETGEGYPEAFDAFQGKIDGVVSGLEKKGYKVDLEKGTAIGPDGKEIDLNASKDAAQLSAGLKGAYQNKASSVQSTLKANAEALEKARQQRSLASKGGGGAGGGATGDSGDSGSGLSIQDQLLGGRLGLKSKKNQDKKDKFLAGLAEKASAKGAVGFAGDDLFKMLQRRYQKKTKNNEFLRP